MRSTGDWEGWLQFFSAGVEETAAGAVSTAQRLVKLFKDDQERIQSLGRVSGSAMRLHQALQERPVESAELTGRRRRRMFAYDEYLRVLSEGTEPLPSR